MGRRLPTVPCLNQRKNLSLDKNILYACKLLSVIYNVHGFHGIQNHNNKSSVFSLFIDKNLLSQHHYKFTGILGKSKNERNKKKYTV